MTDTNIKLIAPDLDGTLLNERKEMTERTRKALERCAAAGIMVVPATGRIEAGIPASVLGLPGVRYAVMVNGAVVADIKKKRTISEAKLSWQKALKVMELASACPVMYDCYIDGFGRVEKRFLDHMEDYGIRPNLTALIMRTRETVDDLKQYIRENRRDIDKINLFFGDMELRERFRAMLGGDPELCVSSAVPYNLEINDPRATKGRGLQTLAAHLGLKMSQVMAFGDGENDISMIREAGLGIAMGNAVDILKQSAKWVTKTNEQDGVAAAIETFIFGSGGML